MTEAGFSHYHERLIFAEVDPHSHSVRLLWRSLRSPTAATAYALAQHIRTTTTEHLQGAL